MGTKVVTKQPKQKKEMNTNTLRVLESLKAIGYALIVGFFLMLMTGHGESLGNFIKSFFTLNFGSTIKISELLARMSYMIPLALSFAVAFKMGIFNIGAAGQAVFAGFVGYEIGCVLNVGEFGFIFTLFFGVMAGAFLALIVGYLKNRFHVHEVISSIMINYIVLYIVKYVSFHEGYMNTGNDLQMDWINSIFGLNATDTINFGLFIMIPLPFILWFAYGKTKWGYKQEMIGSNFHLGNYVGVNYQKEVLTTIAISGALAGLGGVIYITGYTVLLPADDIADMPTWTFAGCTITLLGFNSPIGIILSGLLYSMIQTDGSSLDLVIGGIGITDIMTGFMIIFVARANYRVNYGKRDTWIKDIFSWFKSKRSIKEVDNG